MKRKKLLAAVLASALAVSMIPATPVKALQSSGTAPYMNTWLVAGPSEMPTAEQLYSGVGGDELIRPEDGNWAAQASATATTEWPASPGVSFSAGNAIDGDMSTDWASRSWSNDASPALTLTWQKPIKIKTIEFYDRHDPGWADALNVSNVEKVVCTLKNADGEIIAEKTVEGGIDPTGAEPGIVAFDEAVTGVSSAELKIVYEGNSNKTLSLGFKEVEVYDGDPIVSAEMPELPENQEKLAVASVSGGSTYGSDVAANAIDGNLDTAWKSNTQQGVVWGDFSFTAELEEISTVTSMKLTAYERSETFSFSVTYELYDAAGALVKEGSVGDVTGARDDEKVVSFADAYAGACYNVKTVKFSFYAPGCSSANDRFGFREIEFYGAPGEVELPEDPNRVKIEPVLGEEFGESGTKWQYFDDRIYNRNTDDYNDFYGYFSTKQGLETEGKYIYAHTYVYSEKEQQAQFNFTAMGPHRLWLNDKQISQNTAIGNVNSKEYYKVSLSLQEGWNKLLLQIQHSGKPYVGLYARICDADGNMPDGVTCSVLGPTSDTLVVATQGLDIDREAFEERNKDIPANEYPDTELPRGYAEWPYVWNESTGGAWYGPEASEFQFQAAGGTPGYKWKIIGGALPEGLTLDEDGTISGFCSTETGTFPFTVQVTDSQGNTAEKTTEIVVKERPNQWFEEGGASALSHCAAAYPAYFDSNYSIDLWAERAKDQGITMLSVECKQGPYWWPGPLSESCAEQHTPEVRYQDEDGNWHIKDMVQPFKEAADRYGLRFGVYYGSNGGWQFGHDGAYDMVDIVDLVERYDPWYIFFDGGPQNTDNVEVRWSAVRSYNDRILIQANDQREASDNDLNILEQRYYFDTPYLYGGYWESNMLPQNKKTVIECWNGPYVRYFHGENAQTGLDWRLASKAFVTSIGQGYVWNWDQETSATRGNREWYYNYAPNIPDIYNINTLFNQDMITIRNEIVNWFAPEGKPDKRESLFGTTSYSFDYEMQSNYTHEYRSDLAIKYGEGPTWGYTRRRDNTFYMHMVETYTKSNELITRYDQIKDKTGFTGEASMEAGPFDYEVTSAEWLNEGVSLDFTSFTKNGKYYATIDTSQVQADPVDTIIKIQTADPERTYKLTGVKTYSSQTDLNSLQLRTESNLNDFASVIIDADVTFESSDPSVAAVDKNGLVTKTGNGRADILVTAVYEGVTKTDTYPVVADENGIRPDLDLLGVVMFTGDQEVQGMITPFEHPQVNFQGRTERGGGMDLPFVEPDDITYHYATVDDHAVTTEIPAEESIFSVEDGCISFHQRVNEKTNLAYWADVTVNGETYTTNKMFLWVYPDADLSSGITPTASSSQESAAFTTDGVGQAEDGTNDEIWTADSADENPSLTYDLGVTARISGVEIYFNGSYWGYDNMPKQVKVEVSDDGQEWRTALEATDAPKNRSNYHFDDPNTYSFQESGRYVRLSFPGGAQDQQLDILEVKVRGLDYSTVLASMELEPVISQDGKSATLDITAYTGTGVAADLEGAGLVIESADENIAAVDEDGVIRAKAPGKVKITVTLTKGADTIRDYLYLTVDENGNFLNEKFLKNVELKLSNSAIGVENPITPTVTGTLNTGEKADLTDAEVTYSFSDDRISLVDGKIVLSEEPESGFCASVNVTVTLNGITLAAQEMKIIAAGDNIARTSEVTVSSQYPAGDFKGENMIDGNLSTAWASAQKNGANRAQWFTLDFGGTYRIDRIRFLDRGHAVNEIGEVLLQWDSGELLLTDMKAVNGVPQWHEFELDTPITANRIKFTVDPDSKYYQADNARGFLEVEVYGTPEDPAPAQADKTELVAAVAEAEKINLSAYTGESVTVFNKALEAAKKLVEDESLTEENQKEIDAAVKTLKAAVDGLVESEKPEEPADQASKILLQKTYDYALTLGTDGVVDSAVKAFEQAKADAKAVLDNADATQAEVDSAWDRLLDTIWGLGLYKGDKTNLELLIAKAQSMIADENKYVSTNWQQLVDALAAAEAVDADGDAMDEDIIPVADDLLNAILAQRYKANKANLQSLIETANALDTANYTEASVAVFRAALASAQAVLDDDTLSTDDQKSVDKAVKALSDAIDALEETGDADIKDDQDNTGDADSKDDQDNTGDKDNTGASGNTGSDNGNTGSSTGNTNAGSNTGNSSTTGTSSPKTGDSSSVMIWLMLAFAAAAVIFPVHKKKREI